MKICKSIEDLIGNTPLVELTNIEKTLNLECKIYAKVEMFNPSGSIKARIAKYMIETALAENRINKESVIIEPTSGNTGVGLAFICACKKMKFIAVMPETMSIERQKLIKAYGGEIVLTPGELGMKGSVDEAIRLKEKYPNSFIPSQFENNDNPQTHYLTTGREIYEQCDGLIDILVAGIGTGGTITGISKYLKEKKDIYTIGVEPLSSPLITKGMASSHKIQGIGANFIPKTLNLDYVDYVDTISDEDSFTYARMLAHEEGIFVGISSGAAFCEAIKQAQKEENKGKNIVVILPDTGERYLSTELVK